MLAFVFDSVGFGEWFVLLAVLLVVAGPKRLPSIARSIGRYYAKIGRMADSFKRQLMEMEREIEREADVEKREIEDAFDIGAADEAAAIPDPDRAEVPS